MKNDFSRFELTRRDLMRLLSAGTGLSAVAAWGGRSDLAAALQRATGSTPQAVRFPRGAIVRTLLKDVAPDALGNGAVLFHEHLSINLASISGRGGGQAAGRQGGTRLPPVTDNVELMVELVKKTATEGVSCIVDGGHPDMGRKLADLKTIASQTNVHIVASGGFYMQRSYPPDIATKSENQLADDLVRQAASDRLGAFGEIGEDPNGAELTLDERKVFRAVGKAAVRTGLPVFTHNSYGTGPNVPRDIGLQQLDILESAGARPAQIAIGHTCCLDDPDVTIIKEIAKRGAFVGFDRVTTVQNIMPDDKKVAMVLKFLEAGHADKLLLAADFTGQRTMEAGPGYGRTLTVFVPMLQKAGVSEATLHMILHDNPRRFLAFVPKKA
jgi:phosphotriesterase-related protein